MDRWVDDAAATAWCGPRRSSWPVLPRCSAPPSPRRCSPPPTAGCGCTATTPHHAAALARALGCRPEPEQVAAAVRARPALEVEQQVVAAGGVAAALRSDVEWAAHPQGAAVRDLPLIGREQSGRPGRVLPAPLPGSRLPASGLRVLDLTRVIAGPVATRTLAAWGADVVRVDPPALPELAGQHLDGDFGKRTCRLDLSQAADRARLAGLLADDDALVLGYRPGALARHGLDVPGLREWHPDLVIVELSAWGWAGPWGQRRGFDSIVQVATGIAAACGAEVDGGWRPGVLPVQAPDHATGYLAAAAVLAALADRARSGGAHLRLALARTVAWLTDGPRDAEAAALPAAPPDPVPYLAETTTDAGRLRYVRPPFHLGGQQLDYPHPPRPYGRDEPRWHTDPRPY